MATRDETKVFRVVGRLVANPTNLAAAFPYGGTELGIVHHSTLVPITRSDPVTAEEYGGEETERVLLGRDWTASILFRAYDPDALAALGFSVATVAGGAVVSEPGESAGALATDHAVKLLFAPEEAGAPGWILYRACPELDDTAQFRTELASELSFLAIFRGYRGTNGYAVKFGALAGLTV